MPRTKDPRINQAESDVIVAAIRYTAFADWFESQGWSPERSDRDKLAMHVFNRIEAELRRAGRQLLRCTDAREFVLNAVLSEDPNLPVPADEDDDADALLPEQAVMLVVQAQGM